MKKVILITGASSGIGLQMANALHQAGHEVYGTSRNPEKHNVDFKMVAMDVQSEAAIAEGVQQVLNKAGKIDVLINNAGIWLVALVEETPAAQAKAQFETNFFGPLAIMQAVLPSMRQRRSGHIINISSIAGLISMPGSGVYGATKHALEGLTKSLYYELKPFNIQVSSIKPANFKTEIRHRILHGENPIAAYNTIRTTVEEENYKFVSQGADPKLAADLIVDVVQSSKPKLHYYVGPSARLTPFIQLFPRILDRLAKQFGIG